MLVQLVDSYQSTDSTDQSISLLTNQNGYGSICHNRILANTFNSTPYIASRCDHSGAYNLLAEHNTKNTANMHQWWPGKYKKKPAYKLISDHV